MSFISFDGDETLYADGGNFEDNPELALSITKLLKAGVAVAVITAAGYGYKGSKYEHRLQGLLHSFVAQDLSSHQVAHFYVYGGLYYMNVCTSKII